MACQTNLFLVHDLTPYFVCKDNMNALWEIRLLIICKFTRVCVLREHLHACMYFSFPQFFPPKIRGLRLMNREDQVRERNFLELIACSWHSVSSPSRHWLCDWPFLICPFWLACELWKTILGIMIEVYTMKRVFLRIVKTKIDSWSVKSNFVTLWRDPPDPGSCSQSRLSLSVGGAFWGGSSIWSREVRRIVRQRRTLQGGSGVMLPPRDFEI